MRGTQLTRQWKILRLLEFRKRGLTAAELEAELEAPLRTVYRDLTVLQSAGFPLYSEKDGRSSRWRLLEGSKNSLSLPFTVTELMSLHMSRDILKVFDGTVFQESIESLFDKVRTTLTQEAIQYLDRISGRITVGFGPVKDYKAAKETISQVSEATGKRQRVEILYRAVSTGKTTTRKIDPYQVWAMNGGFYLIGHCHKRKAVRTFALERVKKLTVLKESFKLPKDFSLEEYLQTAFRVMRGDPEIVEVWFSPGAAHVVRERIWHPTQEVREQDDGSLIVTLKVPINYEIVSWILGFGSAAEVLRPASLKKRITEELEASLDRYHAKGLARTKIVRKKKTRTALT